MSRCASRCCFLALLLALAGCSTAPAPQPQVVEPLPVHRAVEPLPAAQPKPLPRTTVFCHPRATAVAYSQLGLSPGELPLQVALTDEAVWVLFHPARLVRIRRTEGEVRVASRAGAPGEEWMVMAADPADGSLWVAARDFGLLHFRSDLAPRGKIRLSREVVGKGVLAALLAGEEALYAVPSCGEYGVWRLGRDGRVLGTDFRAPQPDGPVDPDTMNCASLSATRDPEGRVVVWDPAQAKAFRAEAGGGWEEVGPDPYRQITTCGAEGAAIPGEAARPWPLYVCNRLIFWQGRPLFLGTGEPGLGGSRLVLAGDGSRRESLETCYGDAIRDVATDAQGYAVVTTRAAVFGRFADSPELP